MDFNKLFEDFKHKCVTVRGFTRTAVGRRLFVVFCAVLVVMFFAPLFHGAVGTAIISCVAAPFVVLLWRKYDKPHAVVPAVFLCVPMILDMLIYHSLLTASIMLVAVVCVLILALYPQLRFFDRVSDTLYMFLISGGICVGIVIIASFVTLLVSIAWWLFCLIAFLAIVGMFVAVVVSTAAYTATDDRRQAKRRRYERGGNTHGGMYDVTDARDVTDDNANVTTDSTYDTGYDVERFTVSVNKRPAQKAQPRKSKNNSDKLFYDVD